MLSFGNAQEVLESLQTSHTADGKELFLTMVQGNAYSEVEITDSNIKGNSKFILDMWD